MKSVILGGEKGLSATAVNGGHYAREIDGGADPIHAPQESMVRISKPP